MTEEEFRTLVLAFPGAEEGTSYGHPAFKVKGKFFTRLRAEDGSVVLRAGFDEREMLMEAEPETFHITPHYRNHPAVLARLAGMDRDALHPFLERAWKALSTRREVAAYEAARASA